MNADAQHLVERSINPRRLVAAQREAENFAAFCLENGLDESAPTAVCLYLVQNDDTGPGARSRLARLDLWAQVHRRRPFGGSPDVRTFLRGYYGQHPLGPQLELAEPLYPADVRALVDATLRPTWQQVRDGAFLLLMNATGLRKTEMRELRWQNIRVLPDRLEIHTLLRKSRVVPVPVDIVVRPHRSADVCPVTWIRRLRQMTPIADRTAFSTRGGRAASARLTGYAREIDRHRSGVQLIGVPTLPTEDMRRLVRDVTAPLPIGYRDRVAILFGFLGGLTNQEARRLTVGDVRVAKAGIVLHVKDRPWPDVGLPRNEDARYCPVAAWSDWRRVLKAVNRAAPTDPLLMACDPYVANLATTPLAVDAMARLVSGRADQAGLVGQYAYASLMNGFVRTATLGGVPYQEVAAHVGHRTLAGVAKRHRNETLMDASLHHRIGM